MSEAIEPADHPQDVPCTRLFLISPRPAFFARLSVPPDHPAAEEVAVLSPELPYEQWFEGRRQSWLTKAKQDFLESFINVWRDPYDTAPIAADFLSELASDSDSDNTTSADEIFDKWWTIRDRIILIKIEESWRPA